jgi:glutathione S-transferase
MDQLYLVERLAPTPSLIPTNIEDRILMFGYSNELCGEHGLGWSRRVMLLDATLTNPQSDEAARTQAVYMGGKYGHNTAAAEAAPARVAQILRTLDARLAQQQAAGRQYFIGDQLTALDIYWSTFAVLIQPLPPELCPIPEPLRLSFTNTNPVVAAAVTPRLLAHRDWIYRTHLELPMQL